MEHTYVWHPITKVIDLPEKEGKLYWWTSRSGGVMKQWYDRRTAPDSMYVESFSAWTEIVSNPEPYEG